MDPRQGFEAFLVTVQAWLARARDDEVWALVEAELQRRGLEPEGTLTETET